MLPAGPNGEITVSILEIGLHQVPFKAPVFKMLVMCVVVRRVVIGKKLRWSQVVHHRRQDIGCAEAKNNCGSWPRF